MASLAPAPSLYLGAEAGEQEAPVVYRARLPEGTYDHPPVELHLEPPIEPLR